MRVRFLETIESGVPGYPFVLGQVIDVPVLTPPMREWQRQGWIEVVEEPELATVGAPERAVLRKGRRR